MWGDVHSNLLSGNYFLLLYSMTVKQFQKLSMIICKNNNNVSCPIIEISVRELESHLGKYLAWFCRDIDCDDDTRVS